MSFAKVTIIGRLGQDPESRYLQSGTLVISFSRAADGRRRSGAEPTTTWFRVSAFGEQAERIATMVERGYIAKGRQLYVEGQLEARPYQGNDGQQRTSLDVTLSDWQFIGSGQQQDGQRNQGGGNFGAQQSGRAAGGSFAGNQDDLSQDSGGGYGGSDYGSEYSGNDADGDMNDVPF